MNASLKRRLEPIEPDLASEVTCTKCKATKLGLDFSFDRSRANGLSCWCRDCSKAVAKAHYYLKRDELLAHNKVRSQDPAYKAMIHAAVRRYAARNPQKVKAHRDLNNAIKRGKIKRGDCQQCGKPNAHAHHHDYSKPFEVEWLCPSCHKAEHARERAAQSMRQAFVIDHFSDEKNGDPR